MLKLMITTKEKKHIKLTDLIKIIIRKLKLMIITKPKKHV
jgi:hypothetical protein